MIDYLEVEIDIHHKPFGSLRTKQSEDGAVKTKQFSKTLRINDAPFFVTSLNKGTRIKIHGCPLKVFQGHNVFGTNSLKTLWAKLIVEVLGQLGIKPPAAQLRKWIRGGFRILEIHLTHRFIVAEYSTIQSVITHLLRYSSLSLKPSLIPKGLGIELRAPHGLASWLIYDKYLEFLDKRTKEQNYLEAVAGDRAEDAKSLLLELASKSIRAELKLDKAYLDKNSLNMGKRWTPNKVIEVFTQELGLLRLGEIPALSELPQIYARVDDVKSRDILMLWASGKDMSTHRGKTTREKYRREIRKILGIDILKDVPALKPAGLHLSDIFDAKNMRSGFPKWSRKYPELAVR